MQQKDLNKFLSTIERHRRERKEADDGSIFDGEQGHMIEMLINSISIIEEKLIMVLSQRIGWIPKDNRDTLPSIYHSIEKYFK